jgi:predicted DNA-binding protein YlxM (UPF0122 family)
MITRLTDEQQKKIFDLYTEDKLSIEKISDITGHGRNTIHRLIKRLGVSRTNNKFDEKTEEMICKDYLEDKKSASELAEQYKSLSKDGCCDLKTILNIVNRHGIESRPRGNSEIELTEENMKIIQEMWDNRISTEKIAEKIDVCKQTLHNWLNEMQLTENRFRARENHPMWKGGKIIDGHGYVKIGLDPSDPYYEMTNQIGYVSEHRYVMAKHLGKVLSREYTVHHIDGNKENNDLSNLELRKGNHMPGKVSCCGDCGSKKIESLPIQRTDYSNGKIDNNEDENSISEIMQKHNITNEQIEELKIMWNNKKGKQTISKFFKIPQTTLFNLIKKLKLPLRDMTNHGRWKGGRREYENYIGIVLPETNEFFCMVNSTGVVPEHRYIMAKYLKRPLAKDEQVHHIDGNTKNNNIENLQLVVKNHGKGQRYKCSDCSSINIIDIPFG